MQSLWVLARKSARELSNRVRTFTHSRLKVGVVAFFAMGFWLGLFGLFHEGFQFLTGYPDLLNWVMDYILSLFFFSLTLMLVFSNGIISYTSLFRARETWFLMSQPIQPGELFLYKFSESVVFSSWAFLFLGTPLMGAYGAIAAKSWTFYPLTVLLFLAFVLIPAALGSGIALAVARYFPRSKKSLFLSLGALALLVLVGATSRILAIKGVATPFTTLWMKGIFDRLDFCQKPYLPSYWVARAVITLANKENGAALFYFLQILANGLFFVWLAWRGAQSRYLAAWSLCQSQQPPRRKARRSLAERVLVPLLFFIDRRLRRMVSKDLTTFLRDPVQWSQFLIFFGLLGIYFLNLRTLSYDIKAPGWKVMISLLNLAATALTLSTFTSRFVFPQLSLEGRRFWVIGMIPMRRSSILFGKFIFAFAGSILISELLILVSTLMLRIEPEMALLHGVTMLGICLGLSGLSVGLGAMYPSFQEDNPSKIVGGFGGTLNLVLSLCFVVAVVGLEARPCYRHFALAQLDPEEFTAALRWALAGITGVSLVTFAVPIALGLRALDRAEI